MTRREWVTRCAQRLKSLGMGWNDALTNASWYAEERANRHGSPLSWEKPEDVAEREMAG